MTHITVVQCRLIAPESTLKHIWTMMAQQQTPLVNQLLHHISTHPDINTWLTANQLPSKLVETLAQQLKTQPLYQELPGRFITSAITLVKEMYASWFAVQTQKRLSLDGKKRFLSLLKSDEQLMQDSQTDFQTLCHKAEQLLKRTQNKLKLEDHQNSQKAHWSLINALYTAHNNTKTPRSRAAFAFLIKNKGQVGEIPENPKYYQQRRQRKEIQIRRLQEQLNASLPKGRIFDENHWNNALALAQTPITTVEEITSLQTQLLQKFSHLPFPVFYGTNTDLTWFKNPQGRICVKFNGLKKYSFEIACNKRQYPWFQRFFTDYQCYKPHQQKILTYRTTKQLLSRTRKVRNKKSDSNQSNNDSSPIYKQISNYELFLQYQQQKHHNKHQRHNAQIHDAKNNYGEANLGLYLNRLLAKAILEIAQQYQVSLIILPSLKNQRELIESEIRAKAELKIPGCKEKQDCYAKDYRAKVHQWSYQQLIKCIESKAAKIGIDINTCQQINLGTSQEQAKDLVLNFCKKLSQTEV